MSEDTTPTLDFALNVYREGESRDKAVKALNEAVTNAIPIDFEAEIVTAKGNVKRVRVIGYPVFRGDRCEKLLGVFQEVKSQE